MYNNYELINISTDQCNKNMLGDIFNFCSAAEKETDKLAYVNMTTQNWDEKPNTLLYLLEKTDRFHKHNGLFSFLYDKDKIIACSGVYKSSFDPYVAIGGVRSWVLSGYRSKYLISKKIIPHQISWCNSLNLKVFALTFNEYNNKFMMILNRSGKYSSRSSKLNYPNMEILNRLSHIQGVNQYVMYQKLDSEYKVNFPDPIY
jgi:hypothetical protein